MMNQKKQFRIKLSPWLLLILIPFISVGIFIGWAETPLGPMPFALKALQSTDQVQVDTNPWFTFTPDGLSPTTGLIVYPGGRVDARAYAPAAQAIATQGYLVVIVPMPLNLAVFSPGAAAKVIVTHPEIKQWAIGGHSLGGAMAANFIRKNPGLIQGLLLWASYPAASDNLASYNIQVTSIYGTQDGVANPAKIGASRLLLPTDTIWVAIPGGNHAQFGWYGIQPGDNLAAISREQQQTQVVSATINLLQKIGDSP